MTSPSAQVDASVFGVVFDRAPFPIALSRLPRVEIVAVNDAFLELFEVSREDAIGRTSEELGIVPKGDLARVAAAFRAHGRLRNLEVVRASRTGKPRVLWITVEPLEVHGVPHALTIVVDVTAQREAEAALRATQADAGRRAAELEAVLAHIADGVVVYGAGGDIHHYNPAAEVLLGVGPDVPADLGARIAHFGPRDEDGRPFRPEDVPVARALRRGETVRNQLLGVRIDTPEGRWFRVSAAPILRDGVQMGAVASFTDVTAQREVELALRAREEETRRAKEALEEALEVTRRTEEKFRQAQKMEAVGRLAGGVAHDFNNVLTVILANADEVARGLTPGDPLRAEVVEIGRAGERAAALTAQLLAFSRKQVLEPRVVSVNELLAGLEKMLRRLLGEDVELTLLLDPRAHLCLLDPGQFEQAMLNLAVNARDAMPEGGRLTIETTNVQLDAAYVADHPEATVGPHVLVSVSDTGQGMTAEVRAHLFEPFFTTKGLGRGTGLGLSTVYGIVRQSHGTVWVYSEPGQGTTFKLYFPRATAQVADAAPAVGPARRLTGDETVLLVEDDEQVRRSVGGILGRAGYHVIEAANGGEALLVCEQHGGKIQLLLTDVVMPKMNGRVLAERLRKLRPELRVLFMSGYTENAIVHHGVLDSGIAFIPKPVTREALLEKVRAVLDR